MTEVHEVGSDLRALARRVPPETRAAMSIFELEQRCEAAALILAEADEISDTVKADRKRSEAGKLLRAMSPASYEAEMTRLKGELAKARLDHDVRREYQAIEDARMLARKHPQPDPERVAAAALAAVLDVLESNPEFMEPDMKPSRPHGGRELSIPPLPGNNIFSRRKNRKH